MPSTTRSGSRPFGVADRELGVVGPDGAGAHQHGVVLGPQPVDVGALASGPVIQRLDPSAAAVRPSRVAASLRTTHGRPVRRCVR